MMKRLLLIALVMCTLLPMTVQAQTVNGSWQVYTLASGLREWPTYNIAPDGAGGLWIGHIAGGRGIYRQGGLSHIRADGTAEQYGDEEPFRSCSSVDALAASPTGGVWMQMSGIHDYGQNDFPGKQCLNTYGVPGGLPTSANDGPTVALGFMGADGVARMEGKEQLPRTITAGLAVDSAGRPWIGTTRGTAVRAADGIWRTIEIWTDNGTTTTMISAGTTLLLGSSTGMIAQVTIQTDAPDRITMLPSPVPTMSQAVNAIAAGTGSVIGAVLGRQFFRWDGGTWSTLDLPIPAQFGPNEQIYGQTLAFVDGTFWTGGPQYGLHKLNPATGTWQTVKAGTTPLPNDVVYGLASDGATTLLIATYQGAAKLDVNGPTPNPSTAQAAFSALWDRTNRSTQISWVWGPEAWSERYEGHKEGTGGWRFVRYYDKARMEVSNPQADQQSQWYVTNGLLVSEMVRGLAQYSNDPTLSFCPLRVSGEACPSSTKVAGDIGPQVSNPAPDYSAFNRLLAGVPSRLRPVQGVSATLGQNGGENPSLATPPTELVAYDETTQHNIPRVFWTYMQAQPIDWLYTFGHPITEPYWIRATIGGNEQWTMIQLFERRTLTYTPGNPAPWQVEMGNVGQHYYQWRYGAYGEPPWE